MLSWLLPTTRLRNAVLLLSGLAFYAWGQGPWIGVLVLTILSCYVLGLWLERGRERGRSPWVLGLAVAVVLAPLVVVKYAAFAVQIVNDLAGLTGAAALRIPSWPAPAGISFFTFMALTYLFSVARGEARAQRSVVPVALYTSLFPVVLAGPIVRYADALPQLLDRKLDRASVAQGARRFVTGLAKKVLIANTLASPAALIFELPHHDLSAGVAWFGLVCYTLEIFIDFSAYTDMAIGVAAMLGLRMPENFDYPYSARSVRAFWARWHITLSSWFRDYVFMRVLYPASRAVRARWRARGMVGLLGLRDGIARHDAAHRAVARGRVDLRRLGSLSRRHPRRGAYARRALDREAAAAAAARLPPAGGDGRVDPVPFADAGSRGQVRRRDDRIGRRWRTTGGALRRRRRGGRRRRRHRAVEQPGPGRCRTGAVAGSSARRRRGRSPWPSATP